MYKHYIRVNHDGEVIAAYSDAFQWPEPGDIMLRETEERHFNPALFEGEVPRYTWDGKKLRERTADEIEAIAAPIREKAEHLARLAALDAICPRAVEDLYEATGTKPYEKVKAAIDEKKALRAKIK